MMKIKTVIKILFVIIFLVFTGLVAIVSTIDINQYKDRIVGIVQNSTGRDFQISGDLELAFSLTPTVTIEGVSLGNADWGTEKNMLSAQHFEVQLSLIPLLKNNIQFKRIILTDTDIYLETNRDGRGNWAFENRKTADQTPKTTDTSAGALSFAVNEVRIEKANINYRDGKTGKLTKLSVDEIALNSSGFSAPMELSVEAAINQSPFSVTGTLGSIKDLLANKSWPVSLDAKLADITFSATGQFAQPMFAREGKLQIALSIEQLSDLNDVAGAEFPEIGPIAFNGEVSDTKSGYRVKDMSLQWLDGELAGGLQLEMSTPRPKLIADLSSEQLDLSPFQTETDLKKTPEKKKIFSADPLPLDALRIADIDLELTSKSLITKDLTINDLKLRFELNNGKSKTALSGKIAGGHLNADIGLDSEDGKTAALTSDIKIKQIEIGQLPVIKEKEFLTGGRTDITIKARGTGTSVDTIMGSLNGKLLLQAGPGNINNKAMGVAGTDLIMSILSMLNPGNKKIGNIFECAVINFDIKSGIATADRGIGLVTNHLNISGGGHIDLKTETLDVGIKPEARQGVDISLGQLAGLVRVGGTLADPEIKLDKKEALKTVLSTGVAVATGGASLLLTTLLEGSDGGENPCDIALGISGKRKTVQKKSTRENDAEKLMPFNKDIIKDVGDELKRLF